MCFLLFPFLCSVCFVPPMCDWCFDFCYWSLGGPQDKECKERVKEERRRLQYNKEQCKLIAEQKRLAEKQQIEEDIRECRRIKALMKIREREIVESARLQRLREKRETEIDNIAKEYEKTMDQLEKQCLAENEELEM